MKHTKFIQRLILAYAITFFATGVLADPPFISDDPMTEEYHHAETYLFSSLSQSNQYTYLYFPGAEINYGLISNIEIDATISGFTSITHNPTARATGLGDSQLEVKYRFIQETATSPQVAFAPIYFIPTGNADRNLGNGKGWIQLPFWVRKSWGKWTSYGGGGYAINSASQMRNYVFGGWVLQKNINEKWMLGGEIFTQSASSTLTKSFTLLNLGGVYNFSKNCGLLFSVGHSIIGQQQLFAYAGFTWYL